MDTIMEIGFPPRNAPGDTWSINWHQHNLRAPPRGYHWVQSGNDFLLVAITTGIIADILLYHWPIAGAKRFVVPQKAQSAPHMLERGSACWSQVT